MSLKDWVILCAYPWKNEEKLFNSLLIIIMYRTSETNHDGRAIDYSKQTVHYNRIK